MTLKESYNLNCLESATKS